MSGNRTWVRAGSLASSRVDDEVVLLDTTTGAYFGLNPVAACVWESLAQPRALHELVDTVCARYAVPREQCTRDVEALLDDLVSRGFAEQSGAA